MIRIPRIEYVLAKELFDCNPIIYKYESVWTPVSNQLIKDDTADEFEMLSKDIAPIQKLRPFKNFMILSGIYFGSIGIKSNSCTEFNKLKAETDEADDTNAAQKLTETDANITITSLVKSFFTVSSVEGGKVQISVQRVWWDEITQAKQIVSIVNQFALQPSPSSVLPSSHISSVVMYPFPQIVEHTAEGPAPTDWYPSGHTTVTSMAPLPRIDLLEQM